MTLTAPDPIRQSSIARFDNCAHSLLLEATEPDRHQSGNMAAQGTLFHRWVARAITQMRAEGWSHYPTDMGLELLLTVLAQRDVPDHEVVHLPMKNLRWLRVLVTRWCEGGQFNAQRILDVEERLYMDLQVPDGRGGMYTRKITGQPDVLIADPPDGIIVVDWKAGWARPAAENVERQASDPNDPQRLSDQGYAQQTIYAPLVLANYPAIQRVTLREAYIMWGEYREATIERWQMERSLDILGAVVSQIDAAFEAGPDSERWIAKAGIHCGICPSPRRCPVKEWEGIPASEEEAVELFNLWHVSAQKRKDALPLLKGWVEANGPLEIDHGKGRRVVGWPEWDGVTKAKGTFKVFEPEDAPESPFDARMEQVLRDR